MLVDVVCTARSMQEIQLDKHVKLLDSPGIVMATGSGDPASVVLRNCIKVNFYTYTCMCTVGIGNSMGCRSI